MDTICIPVSLRPYLPLYLELLMESPIVRDGGMYYVYCTRHHSSVDH